MMLFLDAFESIERTAAPSPSGPAINGAGKPNPGFGKDPPSRTMERR